LFIRPTRVESIGLSSTTRRISHHSEEHQTTHFPMVMGLKLEHAS
jgi:hypothetical protein